MTDPHDFVPETRADVVRDRFRNLTQAVFRGLVRDRTERRSNDSRSAARARAAANQRGDAECQKAGNGSDRREQDPGVVPGSVHQREPAINHLARKLRHRFIQRQIDHSADSLVEDRPNPED